MECSSQNTISRKIYRENVDVTFMMDFSSCNYHCYYCCATGVKDRSFQLQSISSYYLKFIDSFESPAKTVRFNAYGEVTLIPGFWHFLREIAKRAKIVLATNLTFDPDQLYRSTPPESVLFLLTTLHPETEQHIEQFIKKCHDLKFHGYDVLVHYIVNDDRVEHARYYAKLMSSQGIRYFVSPMQGKVNEKSYPSSFSIDTKAYLKETLEELHPQLLIYYPELAFTGLTCRAGYDMFCIRGRAISPCMNSDYLLGWVDGSFEVFPEPSPCKAFHANSQCLPDTFLPYCRSYCMGNHNLEVSKDSLKKHLKQFDHFNHTIVRPERIALQANILQNLREQFTQIKGETYVALFGIPLWPYLKLIQKQVMVTQLILPEVSQYPKYGFPVVNIRDYVVQSPGLESLIVLASIYQVNEAREFIEAISLKNKNILAIYGVPVIMTEWKGDQGHQSIRDSEI